MFSIQPTVETYISATTIAVVEHLSLFSKSQNVVPSVLSVATCRVASIALRMSFAAHNPVSNTTDVAAIGQGPQGGNVAPVAPVPTPTPALPVVTGDDEEEVEEVDEDESDEVSLYQCFFL